MVFIRDFIRGFSHKQVSVEIDQMLLGGLDCRDNQTTPRPILINLRQLILAVGMIQTRRANPSNRQKWSDKSDLIEWIIANAQDFKVRINEIRSTCGSEVLKTVSEDFGVGISVIVAMSLYDIKYSTIQKIRGSGKRPDWECQTVDNRTLVFESKGTTSQNTSSRQLQEALVQKQARFGDVKVASLTVLKEQQITTCRFEDPPVSPDNMDSELKYRVLRAGHYSSVFAFLGHAVLSRYFSQMRKRLVNSLSSEEQNLKESIYLQIKDKYPRISCNDEQFAGHFYHIDDGNYLFIGIDVRLLSYEGFVQFNDYVNDFEETENDNHYMLFKDGVLIVEIKNIGFFSEIISVDRIRNYQESNTISDIDSMVPLSFEKYILFLLRRAGLEATAQPRNRIERFDIEGILDGKKYRFELKLSSREELRPDVITRLKSMTEDANIHRVVLITNAVIPQNIGNVSDKIVLIGRDVLVRILKSNKALIEILKG